MNTFDNKAASWDDDPAKRERAHAVADAIRARVPLGPATRGFEFGCGTGLLGFALQADLGHVTLADNSAGMLAVLRDKIAAAGIGNMTPIRFELGADDASTAGYDLVFSLMTLHHVADTRRALADLHGLLAAGGHLCIADLDAEDGSFHGEGFDGHCGFGRESLGGLAEAAGFASVRFDTVFHIDKAGRRYPVFLMVAQRP
ncbi:class I SAM-dependent DNA methyltransferase [Pseudothauera rhizosphaerae]|uniref:Class I SAM-dependent methyltransferase n=1 Tax=Pseudothauera rhizosphaerae TaxID=2565932 RepID=A0A4S4ALT7_9RHOO|nr:class I SAM-dependent methyltransferase [Pseudothauera rhizosphaerae]THF60518.1 class I SAM-dependent methyltransferase [Pseudothauera rhizosphaerae]